MAVRGMAEAGEGRGGAIEAGPDRGAAALAPAAGSGGLAELRDRFPMEFLASATGTQDRDLAFMLVLQLARGLDLWGGLPGTVEEAEPEGEEEPAVREARAARAAEETEVALHGALAAMRAIAPRDGLEGMLAVQMVCAHRLAIESGTRALRDGATPMVRALYMRQAAQLMRQFAGQMEALRRCRGAGEGRLNVGRVNVESGGQAIVGPVRAGEAGKG